MRRLGVLPRGQHKCFCVNHMRIPIQIDFLPATAFSIAGVSETRWLRARAKIRFRFTQTWNTDTLSKERLVFVGPSPRRGEGQREMKRLDSACRANGCELRLKRSRRF